MVYRHLGGGSPSPRIAGFDFDGTLVEPKSGSKFARDGSDWKLLDPKIPELVQKLSRTHRFVVFSNQLGVGLKKMTFDNIKQRIEESFRAIDVPGLAFLAIEEDENRKPSPGMLQVFEKDFNNGVVCDREGSFFVGDSAGRQDKTHHDFSK